MVFSVHFSLLIIFVDLLFYEFRRDKNKPFYEYRWMPRQSNPSTLFGRRLRDVRTRVGIPQDKLGVAVGMDVRTSSARISRHETGIHEPAFATVTNLAKVLQVPVAYFHCEDDRLADFLVTYTKLNAGQ
jgi:DNA-binding XRE family transcriptional regulator